MRKIIVLSMITMDGVMQAPGGPDEDKSGGFKYGGWVAPFGDQETGMLMQKMMQPADLLLGKKTFKIFSSYWPHHADIWPGIMEVNKYAVSKTMKKKDPSVTNWSNSFVLKNVADIKKLKKSKGSDLKVWGSSVLIQSLLKNDLVDEMWLMIHPLTLGKGKKLFQNGAMPAAFKLEEGVVTPGGVFIGNYKRSGKVKTGTVGA
jgi:dihydrofolate reductase